MSEKLIKLGDAATFINGYAFKPDEWKQSGREIIRIQNLTNSSNSTNYFDGILPEKYKVSKGDLLISWSATLGIYEWTRDDAWLNQHIFKVVFDKYEFDKRFFFHLISYNLNTLGKEVHGSTMKHITKERFNKIQIPLPPLETQKKIAAILDKADELRQNDKKILDKYDQLAQSVFLEMFGDTKLNPKKWEIRSIEEISAEIIDCPHSTPKYVDKQTTYPCIRTTELRNGSINWSSMKYLNEEGYIERTNRLIPEPGDILYGREGSFGEAAIVPPGIKMSLGQRVMLFRPKYEIINSQYFLALMRSKGLYEQAVMKTSGSTVGHINIKDIRKFKCPVPPVSLQNRFAEIIGSLESQKVLSNKSLQKSEELFQSLLQRAFRGELVQD